MFFAFLLSLILSCSNSKKTYVIGVSQCSEDNWREKLNGELRDATYLHDNVELRVVSANDNDRQQTGQINAFTDEGVDLLVVSPNQMNTVTPAIDRAYDNGIPVILFDRKTGSGKYTAFVGADNEKIGHTIGEYVAARLEGKGTVAEIRGLKGSSPAIERHRGFVSAVKSHPGIRLVADMSGDWTQQSGDDVAAGMFAKGIVPDYIFAQNDRMALGAWQAAKRFGLEGKIRFVGIDALPGDDGGIRLVRDGVLEASYIYPTRGDIVMQLALNILEGRPYERDNYMKAALVTKDNAETMLMQAEEMSHISGQLEIKFLILYIASRLVGPVPFETLQDLSMCDGGVDYFDFAECLADLVRTEHLTLKDDKYLITRKGFDLNTSDVIRVGVDEMSYDQALWNQNCFAGKKTQPVPVHYLHVLEHIKTGVIDAAVWSFEDSYLDDELSCVELHDEAMAENTSAVLVARRDDAGMVRFLRRNMNFDNIIRIQQAVMQGDQLPDY